MIQKLVQLLSQVVWRGRGSNGSAEPAEKTPAVPGTPLTAGPNSSRRREAPLISEADTSLPALASPRDSDVSALDSVYPTRPSNPYLDLNRPEIKERFEGLKKSDREVLWRSSREKVFRASDSHERLDSLRGAHQGQRCFILGNGPSLKKQDLSLLENEATFVSNWFVNAENFREVNPSYYCVTSHEMFGGWNRADPALNEDFMEKMMAKASGVPKFFSFAFRDYLTKSEIFPANELYFVLFERPKLLVDEKGDVNLDLSKHLDDGYTVIQTLCIPLAVHMGFTEIYLLGCDCDYGIQKPEDPKQYFYDSSLHTTRTTKFESLERIWAPGGPVFRSYEIIGSKLAGMNIKLANATEGGRLGVLPRESYESLFSCVREGVNRYP